MFHIGRNQDLVLPLWWLQQDFVRIWCRTFHSFVFDLFTRKGILLYNKVIPFVLCFFFQLLAQPGLYLLYKTWCYSFCLRCLVLACEYSFSLRLIVYFCRNHNLYVLFNSYTPQYMICVCLLVCFWENDREKNILMVFFCSLANRNIILCW